MSDTFATLGIKDIVAKGKPNPRRVIRRLTNGADIKPSYVVTEEGETYPDVDLVATSGETPLGVAWRHSFENDKPANWDIDDAFADNTWIDVILPHADGELEIYGTMAVSDSTTSGEQTVGANDVLVVSGTTAGQLDRSAEDGSQNVNLVLGRVAPHTSAKYSVAPTGSATKIVRYVY